MVEGAIFNKDASKIKWGKEESFQQTEMGNSISKGERKDLGP